MNPDESRFTRNNSLPFLWTKITVIFFTTIRYSLYFVHIFHVQVREGVILANDPDSRVILTNVPDSWVILTNVPDSWVILTNVPDSRDYAINSWDCAINSQNVEVRFTSFFCDVTNFYIRFWCRNVSYVFLWRVSRHLQKDSRLIYTLIKSLYD